MFSKKNIVGEIETIVGPSVFLKGRLKSDNNIKVQGKVSGEIITKGDVFITEESQIKASVNAKNVVISGEVVGDVESSGEVTLTESAKVVGNINSGALIVKMGAIFIGKSSMVQDSLKEAKSKKEKKKENEPEIEPEVELEK